MRKLWALLAITALLACLSGQTAYASGGTASISGYSKVQQGKTYTYTVKINNTVDFIGTIKASGIVSSDAVPVDYHDSKAENSSGKATGSLKVKIPSSAAIGSTVTVTLSGKGSYWDGTVLKEYTVSKKFTAKVIATKIATPKPTIAPTATPEPTEWDIAVQSAAALQAGGTLAVDATTSAKMPVALLTALKGKQGKLTVNLGNCTCTVDGAALAAIPLSGSIDLAVTMGRDAALSAASGGADVYQLHFSHNGQLPGRFTYTFPATGNKPGDRLYLYYYYDGSGVLEGIQTAIVDDNGNASFDIYHCSSYIVAGSVIKGAAGFLTEPSTEPQATAGLQAAPDAQQDTTALKTQLQDEMEKTIQLENQLREAQENAAGLANELKDARDASSAIAEHAEGTLNIPYTVLIGGCIFVALLAALISPLSYRKKMAKMQQRRPDEPASPE